MSHVHRLSLLLIGLMAFALVTIASPRVVYACSCIMPGTPQQELERSDAVFGGTVATIERVDQMTVHVTFDVDQVWKGPAEPSLIVTTAGDSAACGFEFQPGAEYIVYATTQDGSLATGLCSRTQSTTGAGEDLAALGEGQAPAAGEQPATGAPSGSSGDASESPTVRSAVLYGGIALAVLLVLALIFAMSRRARPAA
jgi:hypothetical protein